MSPIERFRITITEGNLWIYILTLAKNEEIINGDLPRLIFEKFGFLPGGFLTARILFRLHQQGFVSNEKHLGKNAYKTTAEGLKQIDQLKLLCKDLLGKISS